MEQDDLTLLNRCREGDDRAFRTLVERYQRKVYAVAYGMVRDRQTAEDITQDAFIRVHKHLASFKGESSFSTWLFRIASNLCIDHIRSRKNETVEIDDARNDDEGAAVDAGLLSSRLGTNPQRSALRRELADEMERALAQLPAKHREILLLREIEGMSYEDLARALEIPKGTVMSRLFHARAKMQVLLAGYLGEKPELSLGEEG